MAGFYPGQNLYKRYVRCQDAQVFTPILELLSEAPQGPAPATCRVLTSPVTLNAQAG